MVLPSGHVQSFIVTFLTGSGAARGRRLNLRYRWWGGMALIAAANRE
jgi:hypothetical protein